MKKNKEESSNPMLDLLTQMTKYDAIKNIHKDEDGNYVIETNSEKLDKMFEEEYQKMSPSKKKKYKKNTNGLKKTFVSKNK